MVIDEVGRLRVRVRRAAVKPGKKRLELNFIDTPQNGLTILAYTKIVPNQVFFHYSVKSNGYENKS
jgi:hypothetical protein